MLWPPRYPWNTITLNAAAIGKKENTSSIGNLNEEAIYFFRRNFTKLL